MTVSKNIMNMKMNMLRAVFSHGSRYPTFANWRNSLQPNVTRLLLSVKRKAFLHMVVTMS